MLKTRIRRRFDQTAQAAGRLSLIEASITGLQNEDLLDLADIFRDQAETPLAKMTKLEMKKRKITF